jgi:hypothetical protein
VLINDLRAVAGLPIRSSVERERVASEWQAQLLQKGDVARIAVQVLQ